MKSTLSNLTSESLAFLSDEIELARGILYDYFSRVHSKAIDWARERERELYTVVRFRLQTRLCAILHQ